MKRMLLLSLAAAALVVVGAADVGLRDAPIACDAVAYLDGAWALTDGAGTNVQGSIPGDLMTDLENAGVIDDPLYELNWLQQSEPVWARAWTYSTTFQLAAGDVAVLDGGGDVLLVFDGIKMGARITINGVEVLTVWDQFLRYNVSLGGVRSLLTTGASSANSLAVAFDQSADVLGEGRFMACSGGWDWAAYSSTFTDGSGGTKTHTLSKGIWKSVYLATISSAAITYAVPQVLYTGAYPAQALEEGAFSPFAVTVRVHLVAPSPVTGSVTVSGAWGATAGPTPLSLPAGETVVDLNLTATAGQVRLWWPAGTGAQPLYALSSVWTPSGGAPPVSFPTRIGFRTAYLVTGNDTDAAYVAANATADGTSDAGMFFRVNGAAIWARGANMIPTDELEGRYSSAVHAQVVANAVSGGMNMLRVWGGGVFLPQVWYDTCDELGVLVYHDLQYAQNGHSPRETHTQEMEYRHNVRRLAAHPSIAIIDGCNECHVIPNSSTAIYANFSLTIVMEEDKSRVLWPSCPSNGWVAGVNRLTALPNGSPLGLLPSAKAPGVDRSPTARPLEWGTAIETHGPYQHGGGFPAVNGDPTSTWFPPNIPITVVKSAALGVGFPNVFASEFGCSVTSSFYSMAPTLDPSHWGLQGGSAPDTCKGGFAAECEGNNTAAQRNYPCNSLIASYWGDDGTFNMTGSGVYGRHLWLCMVSQALNLHSNIMTRRSTNSFGTLVWQLNEIWPTGGWGSLEYGTTGYTPGQVLGGRWKPLHHWYDASLFRDQFVGCGKGGECYARHDGTAPFTGTARVSSVGLSSGVETVLADVPLSFPAGPGQVVFFTLPSLPDPAHAVLRAVVTDAASPARVLSTNVIPLVNPGNMTLPAANVTAAVAATPNPDGTVMVTVTTNATALWVTLSTLAQGRFSPNAFLLPGPPSSPGRTTVAFIPVTGVHVDLPLLTASLKVEHANMYVAENWDGVGVY